MGYLKKLPGKTARTAIQTPSRFHTNFPLSVLDELKVKKGERFLDFGSGPGVHTIGAWLRGARAIGVDINTGNVLLGKKLATEVAAVPEAERQKFLSEFAGARVGKQRELEGIYEKTRPAQARGIDFLAASAGMPRAYRQLRKRLKTALFPEFAGIPLKSDSVDKILSLDVLHWIHSSRGREKALREILRVAKPGARIMITSDPYPYEKKATSAADHIVKIAEETGAKLVRVPGRIPTYELVSKGKKRHAALMLLKKG